MASISIILKAVDQYSGVITGLNQGFELLGKGIAAVEKIADATFAAIKTGVELAQTGGAFQEQRNQFENLAKSYGLVGQDIIDIVKRTSANTITEFDSISIATRAVAANLSGQDMENTLTYAKRWSEATGESFQSVAEKIFVSLSSGRYSVLRQMGLMIENGGGVKEVTEAITLGLKRFGETGFNTADKIAALNASQDDFWRKIGQSLNASKAFQETLGNISDKVVDMVNDFDPTPITTFFDLLFEGIDNLKEAVFDTFPDIERLWQDFWADSTGFVSKWAKSSIDFIFLTVKAIGDGYNKAADFLAETRLVDATALIARGMLKAIGILNESIIKDFSITFSTIGNMVADVAGLARSFAQSIPGFTEKFGFDPEEMAIIEVTARKLSKGIEGISQFITDGLAQANNDLDSVITGVQSGLNDWRIDLNSVEEAQRKVNDTWQKLDDSTWADYSGGIGKTADELGRARSAFEDFNSTANGSTPIDRALGESKEKSVKEEFQTFLQAVNWPSEFQGLANYLLAFIIAKASDEGLPLAVTTASIST